MRGVPVSFGKEHKEMLGHCKMLLEQGYIAINPDFDKLYWKVRGGTIVFTMQMM
jgi:hypothetical protein